MASANALSGKDGKASWNATDIAIMQWEATVETDVINTTDSDDAAAGWESNIPSGFKRWQASIEGLVQNGEATLTAGDEQELILKADSDSTWTGNGIVQGKVITLQVHGGDAVKVSYTVIGNGALTESNS